MWNSIEEIKIANERIGHHFFESGAMQFFASRLTDAVYGGCYFVTSERFTSREHPERDGPRKFSIRVADERGQIDTVGTRMGYDTERDAVAVIQSLIVDVDSADPEDLEAASELLDAL